MSDTLPAAVVRSTKASPPPNEPFVVVHLDESGATEYPFLLQRSKGRFSRSFVASIGVHIATILGFFLLSTIGPDLSIGTDRVAEPLPQIDMVWLAEEGPGGGGGGGGNESPEPPPKVELPGQEAVAVPVTPKPTMTPPPEAPEPPPLEGVTIPALAMASGLEIVPGTPDGIAPPDSTSLGPGSGGGSGTGRGTGIGSGEGSGFGPGSGGGTGGGVYRPGAGITLPRPVREVKPQYTAEAMRAKIQGEVWLEAVVLPDGTVGRVEVLRSLDSVFGLDQEAVRAARQWRFVPGMRLGEAVPVLVTISMTFTLR
jgi:TonB family protein